MEQEKKFIPYGEEWKKEMMKLSKASIIEIAANIGKEKIKLIEQIKKQKP